MPQELPGGPALLGDGPVGHVFHYGERHPGQPVRAVVDQGFETVPLEVALGGGVVVVDGADFIREEMGREGAALFGIGLTANCGAFFKLAPTANGAVLFEWISQQTADPSSGRPSQQTAELSSKQPSS